MTAYRTYGNGSVANGYRWTGVNLENQVASKIHLSEKITATDISIYVGGYGATAYMYFGIWSISGNLIVRSGNVAVPKGTLSRSGQSWNSASIPSTILNPGDYFLGFWCNPAYRRVWTKFTNGTYNDYDFRKTAISGPSSFAGNTYDGNGVLAAYISGTPYVEPDPDPPPSSGGIMWVKDGSSWKKSKGVYVKDGSSWKQSKGVWIKDGSTWKKSK